MLSQDSEIRLWLAAVRLFQAADCRGRRMLGTRRICCHRQADPWLKHPALAAFNCAHDAAAHIILLPASTFANNKSACDYMRTYWDLFLKHDVMFLIWVW